MKVQTRKKLKKHERPRWRYLLLLKDNAESAGKILKDLGIYFKEIELVVKSLRERQMGRVIFRVNRKDMKKIKEGLKENKINPIRVSGTLKGLLD